MISLVLGGLALVLWVVGGVLVEQLIVFRGASSVQVGLAVWTLLMVVNCQQIGLGLKARNRDDLSREEWHIQLVVFVCFSVLGIVSSILASIGLAHLVARDAAHGLQVREYGFYGVAVPLFAWALFLSLAIKVQSARSLHLQKQTLVELAEVCTLQPHDRPLTPDDGIIDGWEHVCALCLKALAANSPQGWPDIGNLSLLVLRVAKASEGEAKLQFERLGSIGDEDLKRLKPGEPAMLDVRRCVEAYNEVSRHRSSGPFSEETIQEFRRASGGFCSVAGLVYETERQLAFEGTLLDRCVFFRPEHFRDPNSVTQLIGMPLVFERRKVGVLLALGHFGRSFYPRDVQFRGVAALVASAVGREMGAFLEECEGEGSATRVSKAIRLANEVRADFAIELQL